jgi:CheY-like chemotaxis protein
MAVVLVIDPYRAFCEAMEYCLPKFGHVAVTAGNVDGGLELAVKRNVDLVLVDMEYPRMRGIGTCAAIKRHAHLKHLPVVLMLDRVTPEWVARTRVIGADALMPKPFEWADFLRLLARLAPAAAKAGEGR